MKVLVIQQKMIGDVLASTVICQAIKDAMPNAEVHYMVQPATRPVVERNPYIDQLIDFHPPRKNRFSTLISYGEKLKRDKYDAVIDAYGRWESILPTYFSKAPIRIGWKKWYTGIFYTKLVIPAKNVSGSSIFHRLQLANALTEKMITPVFPKIYLSDPEISAARNKLQNLDQNLPVIMISILGSAKDKSLPAEIMAKNLDMIASAGDMVLLFNYIPSQAKEANEIYNFCSESTKTKIRLDLYIGGLREFLGVLSQCNALIGNEGGAVNMAKALDIPTFTIFSPWINKSSWDMLADEYRHVAVHLQDFYPEIYGSDHPKKFKKCTSELYQKLTPELYENRLKDFVNRILKK
ncbi:MAG: glycosyltransferase family 9 protein [Flavobacterium sp.]|nr:glycosyltransferase family 9 protein [Flavobacterium sp.]